MQVAVQRDADGRSNYAMCAVNPSRIGKTFNEQALQYVVGTGYVNHHVEGTRTVFTVLAGEDNLFNATIGTLLSQDSLFHVTINGGSHGEISIANDVHSLSLNLRKGLNLVTLEKTSPLPAKLDYLDIPRALMYAGRGAPKTYQEYEAEQASTNGKVIGPDRRFGTLPSESSGRQAVQIKTGQYVEFTLQQASQGLVIRYSIPDSSDGQGQQAKLEASSSDFRMNVTLTSKYSWIYGDYPFNNNPANGKPHHFFDEVKAMFGATAAAGSKVRLTNRSPLMITLDIVEFHQIPAPYALNNDVVSIVDFGADPTGNRDSSDAIQNAINGYAKKGKKGIFIPTGRFLVSRHLFGQKMIIGGAGPWYANLFTNTVAGLGVFGSGTGLQLYDFSMSGATTFRKDSDWDQALGNVMNDGIAHNIWIEHVKCGMWMDGPVNNFLGNGLVIRNTWADGVNWHKGVTNSIIQNSDVRNTGDDAMAMWSEGGVDSGNKFNYNTVRLPMLANTIAIYGGKNNQAVGNLLSDTVSSGSCIHIGNRFQANALGGGILASDNTMIRCGSDNYNRPGHSGAVWIFPEESAINGGVEVSNSDIYDSFSAGISIFTGTVTNLSFKNLNIHGGQYAVELSGISGNSYFENIKADGLSSGVGTASCLGGKFVVNKGAGNSGWDSTKCMNF